MHIGNALAYELIQLGFIKKSKAFSKDIFSFSAKPAIMRAYFFCKRTGWAFIASPPILSSQTKAPEEYILFLAYEAPHIPV